MTAAERQDRIRAILRKERRALICNLTVALDCSRRTVLRDLDALSVSGFPIETVRGRYGGGVKLADWYQPQRTALCPEQLEALQRIMTTVRPEDRTILSSIIDQFGPNR